MGRLSKNIVGSMVLSSSENIACHYIMPLYSLCVIFDKLPRFPEKRTTEEWTNSVTSSLLELLIEAKNLTKKLGYGIPRTPKKSTTLTKKFNTLSLFKNVKPKKKNGLIKCSIFSHKVTVIHACFYYYRSTDISISLSAKGSTTKS